MALAPSYRETVDPRAGRRYAFWVRVLVSLSLLIGASAFCAVLWMVTAQ